MLLERTEARVLQCANEPCAVQHCETFSKSIDLLVADVVLQDSNGPAVARKVKDLQPYMRLLYISGFSISGFSLPELQRRGLLSQKEMTPGAVEFLQKPFSSEQFLDHVNKLLPN
jgi:response regulator RpfG family c-di-GMP phosphodiesterase